MGPGLTRPWLIFFSSCDSRRTSKAAFSPFSWACIQRSSGSLRSRNSSWKMALKVDVSRPSVRFAWLRRMRR